MSETLKMLQRTVVSKNAECSELQEAVERLEQENEALGMQMVLQKKTLRAVYTLLQQAKVQVVSRLGEDNPEKTVQRLQETIAQKDRRIVALVKKLEGLEGRQL